MKPTRPAIRYHGGKFRMAEWIMQFFPPHKVYVEPFGGAGGVLLQKSPSLVEVYNDLDGEVVNLFRILRCPETRAWLAGLLELTPYARDEFKAAYEPTDDPLESARRLVVRAQMGFGSAGATKGRTGFRLDTRRNFGNVQRIWTDIPEHLLQVGARLRGVLIENRDAAQCMKDHDTPETLHYVDPPYMHGTRVISGRGYYRHEMSDDDHARLLSAMLSLKGMVVVSGYRSEMYDLDLADWMRHETTASCASHRGSARRVEAIWLNRAAEHGLRQQGLFAEAT